jgi:hypothetical protein
MDEFVDNDAIGRAFDRLRPKDRMILVLHHVEERPCRRDRTLARIRSERPSRGYMLPATALERGLEAEDERPTVDDLTSPGASSPRPGSRAVRIACAGPGDCRWHGAGAARHRSWPA